MMNETMAKVQNLLELVIENFFCGNMPFEIAFGVISLAKAYNDALMGDEDSKIIIRKFEEDPENIPFLLPLDEAIQAQIDNLERLQQSLKEYDGDRDRWYFWADSPARNTPKQSDRRPI